MSSKRNSLSKKLRFEVFKRDKFTCQYCGEKAPNVVLEVDHITPVSKKGTDELFNLITSCFDCNRGKSNIELSDDSVITKQMTQLELLQERREQISLLFEWREGLSELNSETTDLIVGYIENKIDGLSLTESDRRNMSALATSFEVADILEAVDTSAHQYLRYRSDGALEKESVERFISKLGGILHNRSKSPIDQKLAYIKGICRNRFNYWDPKKGSIILNYYISALRSAGWNDERILHDLENEVEIKTKEAKNWTEWRSLLEGWTEDVRAWDKPIDIKPEPDISWEDVDNFVEQLSCEIKNVIPALDHIGEAFEEFDKHELPKRLEESIDKYLLKLEEYFEQQENDRDSYPSFRPVARRNVVLALFRPINCMKTFHLEMAVPEMLEPLFGGVLDLVGLGAKSEHFKYARVKYQNLVNSERLSNENIDK